jgi:hypothetical protein
MRMNTIASWVGLFLVALVGSADAQVLVAVDDTYSVASGSMLQVEAPGVLDNDTLDGEPLPPAAEAQIIASPSHGFMDCATDPGFTELCLDGSFEYTPDPGFAGSDTFTYEVSNGGATSNTATVTITVSGCEAVTAAGPPAVDGFRCWVEASYLAKLVELGFGSFQEGFEDDPAWGDARYPATQPSVTSRGVQWAPNNSVSGITTTSDRANTGNYGVFETPHGDPTGAPTDPSRDGFTGTWTGPGSLFAVGGWLSSNTGNAKVRFVLDGVEVTFANPDVPGPFTFFGVIDTTGFTDFEVYESQGVVQDQEFIFGDDFTFGVDSGQIFADGFESGGTTGWSAALP